jgi:hypothetical protein
MQQKQLFYKSVSNRVYRSVTNAISANGTMFLIQRALHYWSRKRVTATIGAAERTDGKNPNDSVDSRIFPVIGMLLHEGLRLSAGHPFDRRVRGCRESDERQSNSDTHLELHADLPKLLMSKR